MTRARRTPSDAERRVAAEIRAEIARQGLNQTSVAKRMGWTPQRLSLKLTGGASLAVADLELIAGVLGVPAAKFLTPPSAWHAGAPSPDPPAVVTYVPMYSTPPVRAAA